MSRGRRGPSVSAVAQASACWRYAVMMGCLELPPSVGSPCLRRCSVTNCDRRCGSRRGRQALGSTSNSTQPAPKTASKPKPSSRHSLRTRGSCSRPRRDMRTASQISSHAAVRSTPCNTRSRLNLSFNSPMTTSGGAQWSRIQTAAEFPVQKRRPVDSLFRRFAVELFVVGLGVGPWTTPSL